MKMSDLLLNKFLPEDWRDDQKNLKTYTHSKIVATAANTIAKRLSCIEPDKAYTYGLMHDIGKFYIQDDQMYKHPRIGYELLKNEYSDIAEICITHSFPDMRSFEHILRYCKNDENEASKIFTILEKIKTNDYVELIQLCDKVSGVDSYSSISAKLAWYAETYHIDNDDPVTALYRSRLEAIKSKFDKLARIDVYKLLGIENT
jgi:putative nucleotidyltransferase with HDIG domain